MSIDTDELQKRYVRPNDHWQCSADDAQPCGGNGVHLDQAENCMPRPSLRYQRGIFIASCTAVIAGFLIACLVGPNRNEFFAPGPLTKSHAQILVAGDSARCASCHGAGDKTLTSWIRDAVSSGRHIPVSQSQLCMECHDQTLITMFATKAHSMSPVLLNEVTANAIPVHSSPGLPDPRNSTGDLACATCHREHHGAEFNLTALTDKQCQTCHVSHVHSFEEDHPEFTNWPFQKRTGIAFDHVSHGVKHFAEKNTRFDCQQCHVDDARGEVKLVAPFEVSCASCHEESIIGESGSDWTLFRLPMLDTDAILSAGQNVGAWPTSCSGDFDGDLPPTMKMLLMSDHTSATILKKHGSGFQFSDLDAGNPEDIADATALAWSIKELLFDLTIDGKAAVKTRLADALDTELDQKQLDGLAFGLHESIFGQAQQEWIPELLAEVVARRSSQKTGDRMKPGLQVFARPRTEDLDDETLAVNPLTELFVQSGDRDTNPDQVSQGSSLEPSDDPPSQESLPIVPRVVTVPPTSPIESGVGGRLVHNSHTDGRAGMRETQFEGQGDVLAINPLANMGTEPIAIAPKQPLSTTDPRGVPDPSQNDGNPIVGENQNADSSYQSLKIAVTKMASDQSGGWYRNDNDFSISYRVSSHIDPLLKSWTDLAMTHQSNPFVGQAGLFESLNSPVASGQCRSCHTAEQGDDKSLRMNWRPDYRDVSVRGFTRFSHRPHDIQTTLQDCSSCHQLDVARSNKDRFAGFKSDWSEDSSTNFAPISKSMCATCHQAGGAPSGCVDCHNYHIGSKVFKKH